MESAKSRKKRQLHEIVIDIEISINVFYCTLDQKLMDTYPPEDFYQSSLAPALMDSERREICP